MKSLRTRLIYEPIPGKFGIELKGRFIEESVSEEDFSSAAKDNAQVRSRSTACAVINVNLLGPAILIAPRKGFWHPQGGTVIKMPTFGQYPIDNAFLTEFAALVPPGENIIQIQVINCSTVQRSLGPSERHKLMIRLAGERADFCLKTQLGEHLSERHRFRDCKSRGSFASLLAICMGLRDHDLFLELIALSPTSVMDQVRRFARIRLATTYDIPVFMHILARTLVHTRYINPKDKSITARIRAGAKIIANLLSRN
jgi:hypothetical protein